MMENDSWWSPQRVKCKRLLVQLFEQHQYLPIKVIEIELKRYQIQSATFYKVAKALGVKMSQGWIYERPCNNTHELL